MKRVTGGAAPAEIWRNFMVPSLPRLQAQAIPGGNLSAAAPPDLIGNMLQNNQTPSAAQSPVPDEAPPAQPDPTAPPT